MLLLLSPKAQPCLRLQTQSNPWIRDQKRTVYFTSFLLASRTQLLIQLDTEKINCHGKGTHVSSPERGMELPTGGDVGQVDSVASYWENIHIQRGQ